jgi:hypothetical protein
MKEEATDGMYDLALMNQVLLKEIIKFTSELDALQVWALEKSSKKSSKAILGGGRKHWERQA